MGADDQRQWQEELRGTDPAALARLYDAFAPRLYGCLLALTGQPEAAADLTQELFMRLARDRQKVAAARDVTAYLFGMARHLAVDAARRAARAAPREAAWHLLAAPAADDTPLLADDELAALSAALQCLPPEQREVIVLKVYQGLSFAQIAAALDVPLNTAASRYRYGLAKLREELEALAP